MYYYLSNCCLVFSHDIIHWFGIEEIFEQWKKMEGWKKQQIGPCKVKYLSRGRRAGHGYRSRFTIHIYTLVSPCSLWSINPVLSVHTPLELQTLSREAWVASRKVFTCEAPLWVSFALKCSHWAGQHTLKLHSPWVLFIHISSSPVVSVLSLDLKVFPD